MTACRAPCTEPAQARYLPLSKAPQRTSSCFCIAAPASLSWRCLVASVARVSTCSQQQGVVAAAAAAAVRVRANLQPTGRRSYTICTVPCSDSYQQSSPSAPAALTCPFVPSHFPSQLVCNQAVCPSSQPRLTCCMTSASSRSRCSIRPASLALADSMPAQATWPRHTGKGQNRKED